MIAELLTRMRFLLRRRSSDLHAELQAHLEHSIASKMERGMPAAEAKRQAAIEFGSMEAAREQAFEAHPRARFDVLLQDLRMEFRSLRRDRGFTFTAVLILAIGLGANIAVFSLVNTILLRPLPFQSPDRLVWLQPVHMEGGLSGATYSSDAFDHLRDKNRSYSGVTGYFAFSSPNDTRLTGGGTPQAVTSIDVLPNFFDVLGVVPQLGRSFRAADGEKNAAPVVMLSYGFWQAHFHGDPSVVNRSLSLNNKPVTVIGVLPKAFDFGAVFSPGANVSVIKPFSLDEGRGWGNILTLIGRLRDGVTPQQATAEARTLFPQLYWSKRFPSTKGNYPDAIAIPMKEHVAWKLRRSLYLLWAAVGLILLIVCFNLSNLLLGRAISRGREFALRFALGASRGRLLRQLLTESCVLSVCGTLLGIVLATAVTTWLAHQGSLALPLLSEVHVDRSTLLWTALLGLAVPLCFGIAPSLRVTADAKLQSTLKDAGPGTSEGRKQDRLRSALIVSEVALACILLVGASLLLRSFLRVLDVDLGFSPAHAASISVQVPDLKIGERGAFFQQLLQQVQQIPGVEAAGVSDNLPLARNRVNGSPGIKGVHYGANERMPSFLYVVSPGYVPAMSMRLRGRDFSWQDTEKSERVLILNEKAARFLFPKGDAVDHMVVMGDQDMRVIGVVSDIHETKVEASSAWQVYLPATQAEDMDGAQLVVRSRLAPAVLQPSVMRTLSRINPDQPAMALRPLQTFVDHSTSPRRFFAVLIACFAGTGLLLACLGLYGVISYSVTRQTQQIGIRMALGASRHSVVLSVLGRAMRITLLGVAAGTVVSLVLARAMQSLLYQTEASDPTAFAAMVLLLLSVALFAGYLPARRAASISPMQALRAL